ncbi:MAG: tRNA (guanosine-2'-O-)-methyltransferase [Gammaproteobacteria bacterium]|jgi:tRNA (guanosine-2'-O-)-methyltransferase
MTGLDAVQKQQLIASLSTIINDQRQKLLQQILSERTRHITVVLEDIFQAQNASAVIRSAECLGLQELHVIENKHEYLLNRKVVQGASKWMEINRYKEKDEDNTGNCLQKLKSRGYKIVAMTLRENSIDLNTLALDQKFALCFGSEEPGLTQRAHDLADEFIKVPMCGFTQSFNLSVCAGISLNQLTERLRESDINWKLEEEDKIDLYIDWLSKSTPTGKVLLDKFIKGIV